MLCDMITLVGGFEFATFQKTFLHWCIRVFFLSGTLHYWHFCLSLPLKSGLLTFNQQNLSIYFLTLRAWYGCWSSTKLNKNKTTLAENGTIWADANDFLAPGWNRHSELALCCVQRSLALPRHCLGSTQNHRPWFLSAGCLSRRGLFFYGCSKTAPGPSWHMREWPFDDFFKGLFVRNSSTSFSSRLWENWSSTRQETSGAATTVPSVNGKKWLIKLRERLDFQRQ